MTEDRAPTVWRSVIAACILNAACISGAERPGGELNQPGNSRPVGALAEYLHRDFSAAVTRVGAGAETIDVTGRVPEADAGQEFYLAEIPIYTAVDQPDEFSALKPLKIREDGRFEYDLDRHVEREQVFNDRLFSRWAVVRKTVNSVELVSHARYPDSIEPRRRPPEERPRNRKGLGALTMNRPLSDLDDLDIAAVTVNISLGGLIHMEDADGRTPFPFDGRTWYADDGYVTRLDRRLREAASHELIVSAIILLPQANGFADKAYGRLVAHPDADPAGIFVMPNLNAAEGARAYAAALHYLAERYSRLGKPFGRIHHWILHNEVNSGWVWTNAGEKTAVEYMDLYQRSLRLAWLITRQYDPHAKVFISLDHHWTATRHSPRNDAGRNLLNLLVQFCLAEGDFDWAIAHHPYPEDQSDPRVWEDERATFSFDTPLITFKNLEVLDAWVKREPMLYRGEPRTVHLTEQGLNSPDYTAQSLREQAAGMAYAWHKLKPLETIGLFHYHNWVDNRGEGDLRIGLRRFPDDDEQPLGKKPVWEVYRALGTSEEAEATAFAKKLIGIQDWSEIQYEKKKNIE